MDEVIHTGKMVPIGNGEFVEQIVVKPSNPDLWPYYTPRPAPKECTIYFLGPEAGPIKIGYATRLSYRVRDLELANAFPLKVWATVSGSPATEKEYHKRFAAHRLHGEWFERHPDLLAEIDRLRGESA